MLKNQYRIFFKHFPFAEMVKTFPFLLLHRLGKVLGNLKRGDLHLFFAEFLIMLKYVIVFPLIFILRIPDSFKKGFDEARFWEKVIPEKKVPSFKLFSPEYAQVILNKSELKTNGISHRILMGVSDEILGIGWSRLISDFPRIRRMGQNAVCFLKNEKKFGYIQIHGLWDSNTHQPWLEVAIEGETVGRKKVEMGWHTYLFLLENRFQEGPIELSLRINPSLHESASEKGFGVNEIGLFSIGSPILRWTED
jgi:hypothetical protein